MQSKKQTNQNLPGHPFKQNHQDQRWFEPAVHIWIKWEWTALVHVGDETRSTLSTKSAHTGPKRGWTGCSLGAAFKNAPHRRYGPCIKHHKQFRTAHTRPPQCLLVIIKRVKHVYCIICEHNILRLVNNSLCGFWLINQSSLGNPLPLSLCVQMGPLPRANSSYIRDIVSDGITCVVCAAKSHCIVLQHRFQKWRSNQRVGKLWKALIV